MALGEMVLDALDPALENREEAFDRVCGHGAASIIASRRFNNLVIG
jgi:hypothetical protein